MFSNIDFDFDCLLFYHSHRNATEATFLLSVWVVRAWRSSDMSKPKRHLSQQTEVCYEQQMALFCAHALILYIAKSLSVLTQSQHQDTSVTDT